MCALLTARFRKVADKGIDSGAHPACCCKLMEQHVRRSVRIISPCLKCINRQGLVTVAHLSREIPVDTITAHQTIKRTCYYLALNDEFPTGNKQKK